jgi:hypothetical protein
VKTIALISTLAFIGLGTAVMAQDTQTAPDPAVAAAAAEQAAAPLTESEARAQEVRCRTSRVTGSRTRVNRVCMTRAEWEAVESRARENVEELQGRGSGGMQCRTDSTGGCAS